MENIVLTQLSIPEIRQLFRQELQAFHENNRPIVSEPLPEENVGIKRAAEHVHLSVPTMYGLVAKNLVPVSKRGNRLYFSIPELNSWIKEGRKKTISEIQSEANNYIERKKRGK